MNEAIELHDSVIAELADQQGEITLLLSPAIIHISAGRPGVDSGEVWLQAVTVVFHHPAFDVTSITLDLPSGISDGVLVTGSARYDNVLPVPLRTAGSATLHLTVSGSEVRQVALAAGEIAVIPSGPRRYLERFA